MDAVKADYINYLKLIEKNLDKNAVIAADNVKKFASEVKDYLDYVRNSGKYKSFCHEFGSDAVEVSFKK